MNLGLLKNIEDFVEKRQKEEKTHNPSVFAATLKNQRLKLNLTLGELTEGICSKSYVSKIENNLLVPDDFVMRLLFEKVNIDYNELTDSDQSNYLPKCITYYLYLQFEMIDDLFKSINDTFFIASNEIVKLFYYLARKKLDKFVVQIKKVDSVKNTLDDDEFLSLMFCAVEYYVITNQLRSAKKYLKILNVVTLLASPLASLFAHQRFVVACFLRDYVNAQKYFHALKTLYLIQYPMKKQFYEKVLFLETFFHDYETLHELNHMALDYIPSEYALDYWYSTVLVMVKSGKYFEAMDTILTHRFCHVRFLALFGYCLKMLCAMPRKIVEVKAYHEKFKTMHEQMEFYDQDAIHLNFVQMMLLEINQASDFEIFDYLKNFLMIQVTTYQHRFYTKYYKDKYLHLLGEHSRYKEAYLFSVSSSEISRNHLKKFEK